MAADQQLVGGQPSAARGHLGLGALGGGQVHLGGVAPAAGVAQGLGARGEDLAARLVIVITHAQRGGPQIGGQLERQRVAGAARRHRGQLGGVLERAGSLEVAHHQERRLLDGGRGEERGGQPLVRAPPPRRRHPRQHRLAHAIVIRLDRIVAAGATGAHQPGPAQGVDRLGERAALEPERSAEHALRDRRAGDRDQLEHALRDALHPRDAAPQRLVETGHRASGVARQLLQEQRVAVGVLDQRRGIGGAARREQRDERAALARRQPVEREGLDRAGQWQRRRVDGAAGDQQHDRQRGRRLEDLAQERQAVAVGPLHVVDGDHQRLLRRQRAQQVAQAAERAGAQLDRAVRFSDREPRDRRDPPQHREGAGQGVDLGGEQERDVDRIATQQLAHQRVDHAVDALERHRLALVAAAGQHADVGLVVIEALDEGVDQRALADARRPLDAHRARGAAADRGQRRVERGQLDAAADERRDAIRRRDRARRQAGHHLGGGRTLGGIEREQLVAQPRQIGRHRAEARHQRRCVLLLVQQDLDGAALERQPAGQRLEQHDADAVAVGGRGHRRRHRLLGRHVRGGADHGGVADPRLQGLAHQAEVEHHHAALAGDQHVRRLEIAVDHAGAVQGVEAHRELAHAVAEARLVEAARQRRLGAAVAGVAAAIAAPARLGVRLPDVIEERHAGDQLHREEPVAVGVEQLAEAHQVAVLEVGAGAELGLQAVQRVGLDRAHGLERHHQLALAIVGLVDHAHAALADEPAQLEAVISLEATRRAIERRWSRARARGTWRRHASIVAESAVHSRA